MSDATQPVVDLRSDTVTKPTSAMRQAMVEAEVGDDVYGEDPTVTALERRVADLLGHEAGLFTPTGSMANQLGLRLHVRPGEELLAEAQAHVVRAELGAAAVFSGITTRTWSSPRGVLRADDVAALMHPDAGPYLVSTAAVAVENTHNFGGGSIQPLHQLQRLRAVTAEAGVKVHLDGARLWNAHVATGVPLAEYGACADTVMVAFSKGLGAPAGSVLVGRADAVATARIWRKRYGGGMRQVGILAAACLHGLDHHLAGLADDHRRARQLADAVASVAPAVVDPASVETNIVALDLTGHPFDAPTLARLAAERGVRVSALGPQFVRLVTHRDVDDEATGRACDALADILRT